MLTVLWLESACVMWADLSAWPSQVPSTRPAALLKYGPVYNTAHRVCRINLYIKHQQHSRQTLYTWLSASADTAGNQHQQYIHWYGTAKNQISIDFRTFYDFSSHFNYNYLHIFSDHLLFNSILNLLLIVHFLLIPDWYFRALYRLQLLQYIATDFCHNA